MGAIVQNPWVLALVVVGIAAVVVYALSRRSGKLELEVGGVTARVDKNAPGADRGVVVARQLDLDGTAGNITGVRGAGDVAANRPVEVAHGAKVRGQVGDITGVDVSDRSKS